MGISTNAKIVQNLTLKKGEKLKKKILNGYYLKEIVIEKKQEDMFSKEDNLN